MNKLKAMIIRKQFKYNLKSSNDYILIELDKGLKIKEEYKDYFYLLDEVPKVIDGVNKVSLDIDKKLVYLYCDMVKINKNIVDDIIILLREFIIENYDLISDMYNVDKDNAINYMKNKFIKTLK